MTLEQLTAKQVELEKGIQDLGADIEAIRAKKQMLTKQLDTVLAQKRAVEVLGEDGVAALVAPQGMESKEKFGNIS